MKDSAKERPFPIGQIQKPQSIKPTGESYRVLHPTPQKKIPPIHYCYIHERFPQGLRDYQEAIKKDSTEGFLTSLDTEGFLTSLDTATSTEEPSQVRY
ncbi:hypothetical protein BC938DRAFT_481652 [Jimgerdemannia flammicorona]|uniref:Uncharacterized protein n=1 Tax=Jimgerdemannia flammicorona TaxID=994334 RepID=A0A433QFP9_9FUNG|nr:hypothetical protein BC938DRAFT_481652 [Jimgerdemannia flammicorona]